MIKNYPKSGKNLSIVSLEGFGVTSETIIMAISPAPMLIATGIISFSAQSLLTTGYKYTTASVASALGLAQIPLMYLSGYLFFDQHITLVNMLGVSLVLFSLIIIFFNFTSA